MRGVIWIHWDHCHDLADSDIPIELMEAGKNLNNLRAQVIKREFCIAYQWRTALQWQNNLTYDCWGLRPQTPRVKQTRGGCAASAMRSWGLRPQTPS